LAAREAGIKIVYLKMGFRPDLSDLGTTIPLTAYATSTSALASPASLLAVGKDDF
jgi:hypothetical protein